MDPVVQVAVISVFATLVTTAGVVAVAIINRNAKKDENANDVDLDVNDILTRLVSMAAEIQRKEASIQKLRAQHSEFKQRIHFLEQFIEELKKGDANERHDWKPRASYRDAAEESAPE